jgi:hypothetical protein
VATPQSMGRTSRISATSESPGIAPLTATGPVALLIRSRSISVTRSSSLRIWPEKQSLVSNVTTDPGSTSSTGSSAGPNDQITWSRLTRWVIAISCGLGLGFVGQIKVHDPDVDHPLAIAPPQERQIDQAERHEAADPVSHV